MAGLKRKRTSNHLFTYHLVDIKHEDWQVDENFAETFTYHLVDIKPYLNYDVAMTLDKFTYHLVDIKPKYLK